MNKHFTCGALAALIGAVSCNAALADTAETKGGIKLKTDDGRFEANIGGRIHFDVNIFNEDTDANLAGAPFGSALTPSQSSTYFRRIYLTLKGKAYGWNYKIEPDFAGNSTGGGATGREIAFQDVYLSHPVGPGELILGQIKPFRSMEDLTSSNDLTLIERPVVSNAGIFGGGASREFQQGLFYKGSVDSLNMTYGGGVFSLRRDNTAATEGVGFNGRFTYAPLLTETSVVHLGVSYSDENPQNGSNVGTAYAYAGRRGPSVTLGLTSGSQHARTPIAEVATGFGPFTAQAEYARQTLGQADPAPDQKIEAWYLQGSYFLTGESKPYKKADGFFGSPKPIHDFGAIELTARYDSAKNKDSFKGCDIKDPTSGATVAAATKCEVSSFTVGGNYYVNPNVRFMLNYVMGKNDRGVADDKPNALVARAQFSF